MPTDDSKQAAEYIVQMARGLIETPNTADLSMIARLLDMTPGSHNDA